MYQGEFQVFGEYTGEALPANLTKEAREEEVKMMEQWEVW